MSDVEGGDYIDAGADAGDVNTDNVPPTTKKTTTIYATSPRNNDNDNDNERPTSPTATKPATATAPQPMTFCGLCDMRILCLFVNGVNISMILVGVLVTGIVDNLFWKAMGVALAAGLPGLVLSGIGLYGCYAFELWAMYLASGGFLVNLLMDFILVSWSGMVITTLVLLPHLAFTKEIKDGVLTKENYSQQEYLTDYGRDFVDHAHDYIAPVN
mmetsp:Transcript_51808/g.57864  ORF Transcript_51808/g.57864 Transcript_51808/m.57864 type:complete len:214 (-) Transcript_51808:256-897(-)